jgi:RNA polymerase sigma factor (TIGR02999 family)
VVAVSDSAGDVTNLLLQLKGSDDRVLDELFTRVYDELRRLARAKLRGEREGHTLGATALVHESYLRLVNQDRADWTNRAHFFAIAARAMRQILVDHARRAVADKRGGGASVVTLTESGVAQDAPNADLLALDEALDRLRDLNERQARVVELRYFAGMQDSDIAEALQISVPSVRRDWRLARAWLSTEMHA